MTENIILKENPKIEFQLLDSGFNLIDGEKEQNSGFYAYSELKSIELNKTWFPRLAKYLRIMTWMANGVPYFPDSCKMANLIFHFNKTTLGIWLIDTEMADQAKRLEKLLDKKISMNRNISNDGSETT